MGDVLRAEPEGLLPRVADDLAEARVDAQPGAVERGMGNPDRGRVERGLVQRVALLKRRLVSLTLGGPKGLFLAANAPGLAKEIHEDGHLGLDDVAVEGLYQVIHGAHGVAPVDHVDV